MKETALFCNIEYSCWEVISKNKIMRDRVSNKLPVTWCSGSVEVDVVADSFPECLLRGD